MKPPAGVDSETDGLNVLFSELTKEIVPSEMLVEDRLLFRNIVVEAASYTRPGGRRR